MKETALMNLPKAYSAALYNLFYTCSPSTYIAYADDVHMINAFGSMAIYSLQN